MMATRRVQGTEGDDWLGQVATWAGGYPIRRVPIALARRFAQVCAGVAAEIAAAEDLSHLEYAVLAYLGDEPDIDQAGLAARMAIDRNTASLLVEKLEKKALLERRLNGDDRRAKLLRLTRQGRTVRERLMPAMRASQRQILSALSPAEQEIFIEQLVRIIKANEVYARPGSGRRKRSSRPSIPTT
jgi:DNA-binding MarR family transcriptional regulator